jgi:methionine synthase II (cobalamin-independent)
MSTQKHVFHADIVGSYLRSEKLLKAREQQEKDEITLEKLRQIENEEIQKLVKFQVENGLKVITDGEVRRANFIYDFFSGFLNVEKD